MVESKGVEMEDQKDRGQDYQGIERQYCREDILIALLDGDFGFNEIVKRFEHSTENTKQGKRTYSRGTVYKYLSDLVEEKKVQYSDSELEYGKLRRPYTLTIDGRKEAEEHLPANIIRSWSIEQLNQFIVNYKQIVIQNVIQYFGAEAYKKKQISRVNFHRILSLERLDEGEKNAKAIDNDLKEHGFIHEEIIILWLMYNGDYIKNILEKFGGIHFFERFPFKHKIGNLTAKQKEEEISKIRDSILLYNLQRKIIQIDKIIGLTPLESILDTLSEKEIAEGKIIDEKTLDERMKESLEKERKKLFL